MNKQEAIQALEEGKTLTHTLFYPDEWVRQNFVTRLYVTEDDVTDSKEHFWALRTSPAWDDGWMIVPDDKIKFKRRR